MLNFAHCLLFMLQTYSFSTSLYLFFLFSESWSISRILISIIQLIFCLFGFHATGWLAKSMWIWYFNYFSETSLNYEFSFIRLYGRKVLYNMMHPLWKGVGFCFTEGPSKASIKEPFFHCPAAGATRPDWQLQSSNVLRHKRGQAERKLAFVLASELLNLMLVFSFIKT